MKWKFFSMGNTHETALCDAFTTILGDAFSVDTRKNFKRLAIPDVSIVMGVKGKGSVNADTIIKDSIKAGKFAIYIDKGYIRRRAHNTELMDLYRFSVNAFQPLSYLHRYTHLSDRWHSLNVPIIKPKKIFGQGTILFCGSSAKYGEYKKIGDPTEYAKKIIQQIRKHDCYQREIVYRPKPSWVDAVPIAGTTYSSDRRRFTDELARADVVVTHGSNACFEAALHGVPSIVLDDGVTKFLADNKIDDIASITPINSLKLKELCNAIAYQQWSVGEVADGTAIKHFYSVFKHLIK